MDEMKRLIVGDGEFEIVDESARSRLDAHNDDISSIKNFLQSLGRKVLAITGTLKQVDKDIDAVTKKAESAAFIVDAIKETYEEDTLTSKYMNIAIGNPANYVSFDLFEDDPTNFGTIRYLRGYGTSEYRGKLYLLNTTHWNSAYDPAVAEVKFYFDGVEKNIADVNIGDTFTTLVVFKRMSAGKVYIHEVDSTGIKLLILTDIADYTKSIIHTSSTSSWTSLYDGGEVTVYRLRATGKTVTMRSDTWTQGEWLKAEIHW